MAEMSAPWRPNIGRPNGPRRLPFDRWFRYPAGFSQQALDTAFTGLRLPHDTLVVDPFAGAAVAGTYAVRRGHNFIGIEAHPEIAELGNLKFSRGVVAGHLEEAANTVVAAQQSRPKASVEAEPDLIRRSFDIDVLAVLVGLRDEIVQLGHPWALHLKWCLLGSLRDLACVRVGWPYQRPGVAATPRMKDPLAAFKRRVSWMVADLTASQKFGGEGQVMRGDSRTESAWARIADAGEGAAVVSSPPYLNNFDYADATRLELYFWGTVTSWKELTSHVRSGLVAASTQQTSRGMAELARRQLQQEAPAVYEEIASLHERLVMERRRRDRGKEYDQLLVMYLRDMLLVLQQTSRWTRPGAEVRLVVGDSAPYGVHVDTPRLLSELGEAAGLLRVEVMPMRSRGHRWRTNGTRHSVLLLESLVRLRSGG